MRSAIYLCSDFVSIIIVKMAEVINSYFPDLTVRQRNQFDIILNEYPALNDKINVISRKDIDNLEVNHILHSLAIARYIDFCPGSAVMDLGSGGGFPGIPLAIIFPDVSFHLIDRIGKKISVARQIAEKADLTNVTFQHGDSGECKRKFDFVVSRAVMRQQQLIRAVRKNISAKSINALPNGLISLKGGDLREELRGLERLSEVVPVSQYFSEPFFETKKIVYTQI